MPPLHGRYQKIRFTSIFGYRLHQHQRWFLIGVLGKKFDGIANNYRADRFRQSYRCCIVRSQANDVHLLVHSSLTHDWLDLRLRKG